MRIGVTGASGFLGNAFVQALRKGSGGDDLVLLASNGTSVGKLQERWPGALVQPLMMAERTVNAQALIGLDTLVHFGWSTVPSTAASDPIADLAQNVGSGLLLMDAVGHAKVRRFIFLSSGGTVYGEPEHLPIRESHPTCPVTFYGASKLCFEQYLRTRASTFGFEHVILRPSNVYGNTARVTKPQGVVEHWLTSALAGKPIEVWNRTDTIRDYIHVDDLVKVLIRVLDAPVAGAVLNVGTGIGTSLAKLIGIVQEVTGARLKLVAGSSDGPRSPANVLHAELCAELLEWRPEVGLEEGVQRLWEDLKRAR